jgi:hypothetical protein
MTTEETVFTVEGVNLRLPLVRAIARDAVELKRDIVQRQDRLLELRERYPEQDGDCSPYSDEVLQMEESLEADEIRVDELVGELSQVGADLVDAESGLVEFASVLDGVPVRLSWMYDEPEVGFWRSMDDGPADRKPLELSEQSAG